MRSRMDRRRVINQSKNVLAYERKLKLVTVLAMMVAVFSAIVSIQIASASNPVDSSGWTQLATGIHYQKFRLEDPPNDVFVARMDRNNPNVIIESSLAQGSFTGGKETVSGMARRGDQAINAWGGTWGSRNNVVVAINGGFHDVQTGVPESGIIQSGWYAKRFLDIAGGSGFAWKLDRTAFIGRCVFHEPRMQLVRNLRTNEVIAIDDINAERGSNDLILFTPHFGRLTGTDESGVEVLVNMAQPTFVQSWPDRASGEVLNIRENRGNTTMQFDQIVLSATGNAEDDLLEFLEEGDPIGISLEIRHIGHDCRTPHEESWSQTYASVGGSFEFLLHGNYKSFDDPGANSRAPRTAICFNDNYIYFLVVDGRLSEQSLGMTMEELFEFCSQTLNAVWGINQDGGGSSAMWVEGEIVNNPSDSSERPVSDGLMMVFVEPMQRSDEFQAGDQIRITGDADLFDGPGSNFNAIKDLEAGMQGTILETTNDLNGVFAKRSFWWKVNIDGSNGWVRSRALETTPESKPSNSILGAFDLLSGETRQTFINQLDEWLLLQSLLSGRSISP